jgi:hypothetical protein
MERGTDAFQQELNQYIVDFVRGFQADYRRRIKEGNDTEKEERA